ncbi:LysE family transporter [Halalkalibacterium halodurans]|uniref:Lysine transporter LysE n=1 Tax=Halalkalibacterium halodurans TaxID=86665 RepID=A0A0M0KHM0_ALKHA|nr:LysE family transporter [Halalkalibacterium halodurans]TPE69674.1 LysE family translocator [Halalkalibacterium halodurans]
MFVEVFIVGLLAGMSPGPDFFIVMKNSLGFGARVGILTSLGIASALIVHITYTVLGFAFLIETYPALFFTIQLLGAAYLIWLGFHAIRSSPPKKEEAVIEETQPIQSTKDSKSSIQGFKEGFITNLLNPKAALFFLSIFSQFITPQTADWVRWMYGLEVVVAVGLWFSFLAIFISYKHFRRFYQTHSYWFDRFLGAALLFFAIRIIIGAF